MALTSGRIICVGNRFAPGDDAGPRVFDLLASRDVPAGVDIVEGGLIGLGLLPLVEGVRRVVFVDQVAGFGAPGEVVVIGEAELLADPAPMFGHADGLAYLAHAIAALHGPGDRPEMALVGIESPADEAAIRHAAACALAIVAGVPGGG